MKPIPRTMARLAVWVVGAALAACNPTVKIEAPDKPIVINLNVHIEQEIRLKVEKDVEQMLKDNKGLF